MSKAPIKKGPNSFFSCDEIALAISHKLTRDLYAPVHEYGDRVASRYYRAEQTEHFLKKFLSPRLDTSTLEELTFQKFRDVNAHMASYKDLETPDPNKRITRGMPESEKILLRARALMHHVLGDFRVDEWFHECKNSQGSSLGVSYSDTSEEAKFTYPMSTTVKAKSYMNQYLSWDNSLDSAIQKWNKHAVHNEKYEIHRGSRATTVDKTSSISRLICIEPTCNMFLQQGLMQMMYKRMREVGLDVESLPTLHRQLAWRSSITREFATIDWSSASDCVSIGLLRWLLPPKWFGIVDDVRSPVTTIDLDSVELNMFSTMGNAVTFPLETLVFWTMAHAVRLTQDIHTNSLFPEWDQLKLCSVFGDDCIVPVSMAEPFIKAMTSVGFIINKEKSFYGDGPFRESCGGDFHAGHNVRPYFLKAPRSEKRSQLEPWLYIILNSLTRKYISYFGPLSYVYNKHVFRYIFSLFAKYKLKLKLVPSDFPDDAGFKMSQDIERFYVNYPIRLEKIAKSEHGTYSFLICSFRYREEKNKDHGIRFALRLKKPTKLHADLDFRGKHDIFASWVARPSMRGDSSFTKSYSVRRKGGYVVERAISCHWHVPPVSRLEGPKVGFNGSLSVEN